MESLSNVVRVSLPNYLRDLPIPTTVFGWFQLGLGDWAKLLPFGTVAAGISYLAVQGLANAPGVGPVIKEKLKKVPGFKPNKVNCCIKQDSPKVVDILDMEDLGDKGVFCRCWKSKKFPYCDGSHAKHNEETGDNVGPLIVKRK